MAITPLDQKAALVIIDLQIFPRLGENGTIHEILDLLKKRFE
jgi:hypothetical protein